MAAGRYVRQLQRLMAEPHSEPDPASVARQEQDNDAVRARIQELQAAPQYGWGALVAKGKTEADLAAYPPLNCESCGGTIYGPPLTACEDQWAHFDPFPTHGSVDRCTIQQLSLRCRLGTDHKQPHRYV